MSQKGPYAIQRRSFARLPRTLRQLAASTQNRSVSPARQLP